MLEKFAPYDTVLTLAAATELTEAGLSAACIPHVPIGSLNSSNSSLHRHRLGEIAEHTEDLGLDNRGGSRNWEPKSSRSSHDFSSSGRSDQRTLISDPLRQDKIVSIASNHPSASTPSDVKSPKSISELTAKEPQLTAQNRRAEPKAKSPDGKSRTKNFHSTGTSSESQPSASKGIPLAKTADTSDSPADQQSTASKIRLGPRPATRRPATPGLTDVRPVANLPNSVRVTSRRSSRTSRPSSSLSSHRPVSQLSNKSFGSTLLTQHDRSQAPAMPQSHVNMQPLYPAAELPSVDRTLSASLPTIGIPLTPIGSQIGVVNTTPEKQRLMRALQLRKKEQLMKTKLAAHHVDNVKSTSSQSARRHDAISLSQDTVGHASQPESVAGTVVRHIRDEPVTPKSTSAESEEAGSVNANNVPSRGPSSVPEPRRVNSSLDSKAAELTSVPSASESVTSVASAPSSKCTPSSHNQLRDVVPMSSGAQSRLEKISSDAQLDQTSLRTPQMLGVHSESNKEGDEPVHVSITQTGPKAVFSTENAGPRCNESSYDIVGSEEHLAMVAKHDAVQTWVTDLPTRVSSRQDQSAQVAAKKKSEACQVEGLGGCMIDAAVARSSLETSEDSSDEALFDEIQNATLEEAKPVVVGRSGVGPIVSKLNTVSERKAEPPISTPEKLQGFFEQSSSAAPRGHLSADTSQSLKGKSHVSWGISRRIKALEELGICAETSPTSQGNHIPPSPPYTGGSVKARMSSQSGRESIVRSSSMSDATLKELQYSSPVLTPLHTAAADRHAQGISSKPELSSTMPVASEMNDSSTLVKARVVEDTQAQEPGDLSALTDPPTAKILPNSLIVESKGSGKALSSETKLVEGPSTSDIPNTLTSTGTDFQWSEWRRMSSSSSHSNLARRSPSENYIRRCSVASRNGRSSSGKPPSASDSYSDIEDKSNRGSRKARLMNRMSLLAGASRRSIASAFGSNPLYHEPASGLSQPPESIAEDLGEISRSTSSLLDPREHVVDIGDVNIQFPDTLLWKRRFVRIDEQGYLVLTPPTMDASKHGVSRRFHLTDFRKPSLPTPEREELPWSVVLDFEDGSCLQCACESRYVQGQMLRSKFTIRKPSP